MFRTLILSAALLFSFPAYAQVERETTGSLGGTVINDDMGDEVRVTVIAAGFDRWEGAPQVRPTGRPAGRTAAPARDSKPAAPVKDIFSTDGESGDDGDDDFDVPSFLK